MERDVHVYKGTYTHAHIYIYSYVFIANWNFTRRPLRNAQRIKFISTHNRYLLVMAEGDNNGDIDEVDGKTMNHEQADVKHNPNKRHRKKTRPQR